MGFQEAVYPGVKRLLARLSGPARKPVLPHERTCIIHAGGHKTGTSALQAFLALNRKRLLKRGYLIPSVGLSNGEHHHLVFSLAGAPISPRHLSYADDLASELRRHDHDHIIISSERIETLFRDERAFRETMKCLSSLGYRIRFLYYVRNAPQLMNSRYNQLVKTYNVTGQFSEFVAKNTVRALRNGLSPNQLLKFVDDQTAEWIIRPYSEQIRAVGTERDFLNCVGLGDFVEGDLAPRSNESVGPLAVEAARRSMNEIASGGTQLTRRQRVLCGLALKSVLDELVISESAYCGLTSQLARTIEVTLQPQNDEFAERVWGRSWAEVFSGDVGLDYTSNDLADVALSPAQREALDAVAEMLRPRIKEIVTRSAA